ncbi:DUF4412 domain-containing protein [Candidatus Micrarchaeota archaeon]|nr:DUF4412 domain-containing protein [Candidatus Micrarchaeota archaeon]
MNKKILIPVILLLLTVGFAGCPQQPNGDKGNPEMTLQEILAKGKNIDNIEYDLVVIKPFPVTAKFYQKGIKVKTETSFLGQTQITIFNGEKIYTYDSATDTYYETSAEGSSTGLDFKDFSSQALNDTELKEIGRETINNMPARKIEFNYKEPSTEEKTKISAWISEEYGIPIKMLMETSMGSAEMELKNIKTGLVSDSVFEIPADKIKPIEEMYS